MSDVLVPYTDFDSAELAGQLHEVVASNVDELAARNLGGVILRYGQTLETAEAKVRKGQREHDELNHFAVVNAAGNVVGSASIYPDLKLNRLRLPVPPIIAKYLPLVAVEYSYAKPNVHAWTSTSATDALASAYQNLGRLTANASKQPWTIEPTSSPQHVHEAITAGNLQKIETARFDDGESRKQIPQEAILYARLRHASASVRGKRYILKTGELGFWAGLSEDLIRDAQYE